jgi:Arc/MetJ-type ribon-helix-helix transcriptional regulator
MEPRVETEKVCVNLPAAELGKIDVLVAEGLFASRTDVVRTGIRLVLESHDDALQRVVRKDTRVGYQLLTTGELQRARLAGLRLNLYVIGVLRISGSVTPELADAAIEKIRIFGALRGPEAVIECLADRTVRGADILLD